MKQLTRRLVIAAAASIAATVAHADIAVVVHPDSPLASMTTEELAAIYLGRDASFRPIDLPESGGLRNWFYYQVTGRDALYVMRDRTFGKQMAPTTARNSIDAVRRVAASKRVIAYVDTRAVDTSVKVVMTIKTPELLEKVRSAADF
jgi:hypothetical protein